MSKNKLSNVHKLTGKLKKLPPDADFMVLWRRPGDVFPGIVFQFNPGTDAEDSVVAMLSNSLLDCQQQLWRRRK